MTTSASPEQYLKRLKETSTFSEGSPSFRRTTQLKSDEIEYHVLFEFANEDEFNSIYRKFQGNGIQKKTQTFIDEYRDLNGLVFLQNNLYFKERYTFGTKKRHWVVKFSTDQGKSFRKSPHFEDRTEAYVYILERQEDWNKYPGSLSLEALMCDLSYAKFKTVRNTFRFSNSISVNLDLYQMLSLNPSYSSDFEEVYFTGEANFSGEEQRPNVENLAKQYGLTIGGERKIQQYVRLWYADYPFMMGQYDLPKNKSQTANENTDKLVRKREVMHEQQTPVTDEQRDLSWVLEVQKRNTLDTKDLDRVWKLINHENIAIRRNAEMLLKKIVKESIGLQDHVLTQVQQLGDLTILEQLCCAALMIDLVEVMDSEKILETLEKLPEPRNIYYKVNDLFTRCLRLAMTKGMK